MSNLGVLLKIEFSKFLSTFAGKRGNRPGALFWVVFFLGVLFAGLSALYTFILSKAFVDSGVSAAPVVGLFAGGIAMLVLVSTINQARGIYIGSDYDTLSAMPIRKRDIVAAKILALFLTELSFSLILMAPNAIVLLVYAKDVTLFASSLLLGLALPIFPILVGVLLSLLTTLATARFRSANVFVAIFYAIFIAGFSLLSVLTRNTSAQEATSSLSAVGNALKWLNPTYILIEMGMASSSSSWIYLLLFVAVNLAILGGTIAFLSLLFDRLHEMVTGVRMKPGKTNKVLKNKNESKALLSLEFKRLFASKNYFVNSCMGAIMGIVGSSIYLFLMNRSGSDMPADAKVVFELLIMPIFVAISALVFGISCPAVSAISIEGKTFWIIKSLPIDYKKYMHAKLAFTLILFLPASLIASSIAVIFRHDNPLDIVMAYVIPLIYILFSAVLGLLINLRHPKLKWDNENEVVKNSASVVIAMLLNFLWAIILSVTLIVATIFLKSPLVPYIVVASVLAVATVIIYLVLRRIFPKKIEEIEDL